MMCFGNPARFDNPFRDAAFYDMPCSDGYTKTI